jgi:hypothetical protein
MLAPVKGGTFFGKRSKFIEASSTHSGVLCYYFPKYGKHSPSHADEKQISDRSNTVYFCSIARPVCWLSSHQNKINWAPLTLHAHICPQILLGSYASCSPNQSDARRRCSLHNAITQTPPGRTTIPLPTEPSATSWPVPVPGSRLHRHPFCSAAGNFFSATKRLWFMPSATAACPVQIRVVILHSLDVVYLFSSHFRSDSLYLASKWYSHVQVWFLLQAECILFLISVDISEPSRFLWRQHSSRIR